MLGYPQQLLKGSGRQREGFGSHRRNGGQSIFKRFQTLLTPSFLSPGWDRSQTQGEDAGHGKLQSGEGRFQLYGDSHLPFTQSLT